MNLTNNTNNNYRDKMALSDVDELANSLCKEFGNEQFKEWYCKVIHTLGPERTETLKARVRDSNFAPKLFSKLANEEMQKALANKKLSDIKNR